MQINNKFNIGDKVYLKSDIEQLPHIVTEIIIQPGNMLCYQISQGHNACVHYEMEISSTESYEIKVKYNGGI